MKTVVDDLLDGTDWAGTGSVVVNGTNEVPQFIAGAQASSVVFYFPAGSNGESIEKTYSVDVTGLDQLVFSLWSRNLGGSDFPTYESCQYHLIINGTLDYGIPTWKSFIDVTFDISSIDTITSIAIECDHDVEDYLVMSYMVASADQLPLDIFTAIQEHIARERDRDYPNGISVGTLTATAGDSVIDIVGSIQHLYRYAVVKIDGGGNSETHQLADEGSGGFEMSSLFDGKTVLNDYTAADVYLQIPINIYQTEKEIMFPSITLHGMEVQPIMRSNELEYPTETRDATGFTVLHHHIYQWPVNLEIISRSLELNAIIAAIVRRAMSLHKIWINGRYNEFSFEESAVEEAPVDSFDVIPRLAYTVTVEVKERVWRRSRPARSTATSTFTATRTLP
jgi:hypothetical protein